MAAVEVAPQAHEQLDALPREIRLRVVRLLDRLERWPEVSGAKALTVEKIGHRDGFYDD